jgi:hypothetical protein
MTRTRGSMRPCAGGGGADPGVLHAVDGEAAHAPLAPDALQHRAEEGEVAARAGLQLALGRLLQAAGDGPPQLGAGLVQGPQPGLGGHSWVAAQGRRH